MFTSSWVLSLSWRLGLLAFALHLLAALCPAHIPHGNHGNGVVNTGTLAGTFKAGQTVLTRAPVSLKGTVVMETPIGSTTGKGFANLNSTSYWQRATGAINPSGSVPAANSGLRVASPAGGQVLPGSVLRTINKGESVAGLIDEAKTITHLTGNEVAAVSLQGGQRVLVQGGPGGISFEGLNVRRMPKLASVAERTGANRG